MSARDLPVGWEAAEIADVCDVGGGLTKNSSRSGLSLRRPYLRVANVYADELRLSEVADIGVTEADAQRAALKAGDVLVVEGNGSIDQVGRVAMWDGSIEGCLHQNHLIRVRSTAAIRPKFLLRWMLSPEGRRAIERKASSSAGLHTLSISKVASLPIPVPPLPEQHRIAETIEALTTRSRRAREALDTLPALIDGYRQSILAAAFRGDLTAVWRKGRNLLRVPDDHFRSVTQRNGSRAIIGEQRAIEKYREDLPSSWKRVFVRDVARLQPGYAFKSSWFSQSGVRLLRGTNIVPGGTRWEDTVFLSDQKSEEFPEFILNIGDIVIAMDRPFISSGLKVAKIIESDTPALLLQRVGRFHLSEAVDADYFWFYLHSAQFLRHILAQATGSDLPHVSATDIESAPINVPSIEEQKEIVRNIANNGMLEKVCSALCSAHSRLATLDQSILAKAFRGELVPQDPNDEPASVLLERIRAERAAAGPAPRRGRRPKAGGGG